MIIRLIDKALATILFITGLTCFALTGAAVDTMEISLFVKLIGVSAAFLASGGACAWISEK